MCCFIYSNHDTLTGGKLLFIHKHSSGERPVLSAYKNTRTGLIGETHMMGGASLSHCSTSSIFGYLCVVRRMNMYPSNRCILLQHDGFMAKNQEAQRWFIQTVVNELSDVYQCFTLDMLKNKWVYLKRARVSHLDPLYMNLSRNRLHMTEILLRGR